MFLQKIKKTTALLGVVAMLGSSLYGCNTAKDNDKKQENTTKAEQSAEATTEAGVPDDAVYKDATKSTDERVADLMSRMSMDQKIAQMIMAEHIYEDGATGASPTDVKRYGLGAVLSGGGSAPSTGNTAQDWNDLINEYKKAASESELGIPLIYGVDSVHGNSNVSDTTIFPHQIGIGATGDAKLAQQCAEITALETRAIAANYAFSPVLGMGYNERWGRFYECFGEKSELVSEIGTAYINGLQGVLGEDDFLSTNHLICSAKHFIGEGQAENGINQGNVRMDEAEWEELLNSEIIKPYKAAVDAGVQTVMVSYNSINGVNCHENKHLVTDVLKGELGFKGFVIGDYNGVEHCKGADFKEQLENCVNAGVDMLMEPYNWQDTYYKMKQLVEEGKVSEDRVNDAVSRILKVKFDAGFFDEEIGSESEKALLEQIGSDEHRGIARQAVRESLTLLKNSKVNGKSAIEAINESKNIAVVGAKSNNIGAQCGGWTISWTGSIGDITKGTTLLEGFEEVAADKTFTYCINADAIPDDADGVIVVVGENPYSETQGDTDANGLKLKPLDQDIITKSKEKVGADVPVILVLITGRPLCITEQLSSVDGFACAWLPGTEGAGVADVIFGDYDFTGKLPVTWPKDSEDIPTKLTDESVVLYPYGTGYTKSDITD